MKIVKILLAVLGALSAALLALILVCYFRPGTSDAISDFLYKRGNLGAAEADTGEEAGTVPRTETGTEAGAVPLQTAENDSEEGIPAGLRPANTGTGYEAPDEGSIAPPTELTERTGYEPIQDTGEEIPESEAEQLKETLGYGNTGEGLTFDETMYPYYHMLEDAPQSLYRQIYANANDLTRAFVPVELVSPAQLKSTFAAVVNDHPELFWVDTAYSYKYAGDGTAEIDLQFNRTADDMEAAKELFNSNAEEILSGARNLSSAYDQEVFVHDRLIEGVSYQLGAPMNQSAYSALVSKETVCAGYARAFQYLMQQLSVPCYYCTGYAGQNHAWNIIQLDDGFYNADATWDDTDPSTYDYFNCSDADYAQNHVRRELSVYLPACNGEKYRGLLSGSGEAAAQAEVQKRTLQDAGFGEDQVVNDLKAYYDDCYSQLNSQQEGSFSFQNVVRNNDLMQEIYAAYKNEGYKAAFMDRYMQEKGIASCSLNVSVEELADGYFLVNHDLNIAQ